MSDAVINSTVDAAVLALVAAVWAGAIVALVALWSVDLSRRLLAVQATAIGALSLLLLPFFLQRIAAVLPMGMWLSLGGNEIAVPIAFRIDAVALAVLSAISFLVAGQLLRPFEQQLSPRSTVLHIAFFETSLLFVLSGDLLGQLALWQLMAVIQFVWKSQSGKTGFGEFEAAVTARRQLQFRLAADCCILLGIVTAVSTEALGTTLDDPESLFSSGLLIVLGVLLRSFCFPFFAGGRIDSNSDNMDGAVLDRLVVVPSGFYLLARCAEFPGISPFASGLLLSVGTALALIGVLVVAARASREFDLNGLSVAITGMLLAGVASRMTGGISGATVLFFSQAVILFAVGHGQVGNHSRQIVVATAAVLFASGLAGNASIVSALWRQIEAAGGIKQSLMLTVVVISLTVAHGIIACVLMRQVRADHRTQFTGTNDDSHNGRAGGDIPLLLGFAVATAISLGEIFSPRDWAQSGYDHSGPPDYLLFALIALIGGIGAIVGWMRQRPDQADVAEHPERIGRFRARLAAGFRLDETFLLVFSLPLRAVAMMLRFFEWIGIGQFKSAPNRIPDWAARVAAPLKTESARFVVLSILLATAALLVTVVGLGGG